MEKNEDSCGAVEGAAAGRRRSSMKTGKRPEGFSRSKTVDADRAGRVGLVDPRRLVPRGTFILYLIRGPVPRPVGTPVPRTPEAEPSGAGAARRGRFNV